MTIDMTDRRCGTCEFWPKAGGNYRRCTAPVPDFQSITPFAMNTRISVSPTPATGGAACPAWRIWRYDGNEMTLPERLEATIRMKAVQQCIDLASAYEGRSADDAVQELINLRDHPEQYEPKQGPYDLAWEEEALAGATAAGESPALDEIDLTAAYLAGIKKSDERRVHDKKNAMATIQQLADALQAAESYIVDGGHCEATGSGARDVVAQIRLALGKDGEHA